jgi:hypothetical protein
VVGRTEKIKTGANSGLSPRAFHVYLFQEKAHGANAQTLANSSHMRILVSLIVFGLTCCTDRVDDKYKNMTIEERIISNDDNALLFKYLKIDTRTDSIAIINKSKGGEYYYHEALANFWDVDGKSFPDSIKFLVDGHGVMVIPATGKIFAFQFGLRDFAFRYDFSNSDIKNIDELRVLHNLDGIEVDIRDIKEDWVLGVHFLDDTENELIRSYQQNAR